jgi:predicted nucleic acid-binding protein
VKGLVLDASLALEWFTAGASKQVLAKRSLLGDHVALVPHLWRYEVMNVVSGWLRRKEVSEADAASILSDLMQLPFAVVDEGSPEAVVALAVRHRLSAYDAAYLHVAMITGEPLATLDRDLLKAARGVGVVCV